MRFNKIWKPKKGPLLCGFGFRDIPVKFRGFGLLLCFGLLFLSPNASANRKSQTIRNLILEKRYDEAKDKCERWDASKTKGDKTLREACAQAWWPTVEGDDQISSWKTYQEKWKGTEWAEKAFWREGKATLRDLGETGSEEDYIAIAERFEGTEHESVARKHAASAAIRAVTSPEVASLIARKYEGNPELPILVERFPETFVQFQISGRSIHAHLDPPIPYDLPSPMWVGRYPTGALVPWQDAVKEHLKSAGISEMVVMRTFRGGPGVAGTMPLCPLPDAPPGFVLGVSVSVGEKYAFREVPFDANCLLAYPVIMSFESSKLMGISVAPQHFVAVPQSSGASKETFDFVQPIGDVSFYENRMYRSTGRTFAVAPLNGAPGWLTDKPPGNGRVLLNTLKGTGPSDGWTVKVVGQKLRIMNPKQVDWTMPNSELRFLSPLASYAIGLQGVIISPPSKAIRFSGGDAPMGAQEIQPTELKEDELLQSGYQLASAGLKTEKIELADGWRLDLDNDSTEEQVLRGQYKGKEVVFILDNDDVQGKRTFIYTTKHAMNAGSSAPRPKALKVKDMTVLYWRGVESGESYIVQVYSDRGGFDLKGN